MDLELGAKRSAESSVAKRGDGLVLKGTVILRVTADGYSPADPEAVAQHAKQRVGEAVAARIMRSRSLPQLRLYWSILEHVAKATKWECAKRLHVALKVRLGYYDLEKMPNGKVVPVVDSASFDGMTQDEFQAYFDQCMGLITTEVLPGYDPATLIREAEHA